MVLSIVRLGALTASELGISSMIPHPKIPYGDFQGGGKHAHRLSLPENTVVP